MTKAEKLLNRFLTRPKDFTYNELVKLWFWQLKRRSQRTKVNWDRMKRIKERWLPNPKFYHTFPSERLVV